MKLLIFTFCAFLELSTSFSFENKLAESPKLSHSNEISFPSLHKNQNNEAMKLQETKITTEDKNGYYFFLTDSDGKMTIINEIYEEVTSYNLPEVAESISAIVNNIFYNIMTLNGTILSTNLENLLNGPDEITWSLAGAFPEETKSIRSSSAVNGSVIYFVTYSGSIYSYDTTSKITYKVGTVGQSLGLQDNYASLAVVENVLYIYKFHYFYSFNGTSVNSIKTIPVERHHAGLFQQGSDVCLVGGNYTNVYPDPVYCYNPNSKEWSTPSFINYARWYPGVVTVGLRTYIFGGQVGGSSDLWRDSVEVLNQETNIWGFFPSPLTEGQQYLQVVASIPLENKSDKKPNGEAIKHQEIKLPTADKRDYIFLNDEDENVIIIDATANEIINSYYLPEISSSTLAVINETFYNIIPKNGTILTTNVRNILEGPDNIVWNLDDIIPKESNIVSNAAVNGSVIYYITNNGNLYSYDTISKITFKVGNVGSSGFYASLVLVENVLYIHKNEDFYSFNGTSVSSITIPAQRANAGLFQQGSDVCVVGGNLTNVYPDPVYCYNPSSDQWSTPSRIYYPRWYPGVATVGLKTYIFGGEGFGTPYWWFNSVEVLDHTTNQWGFYPSPLTDEQRYIEAITFNF